MRVRFFFIVVILFYSLYDIAYSFASNDEILSRKWMHLDTGAKKSIEAILSVVSKTEIGERLLIESKRKYGVASVKDLVIYISPGINSYTDSTLHRVVSEMCIRDRYTINKVRNLVAENPRVPEQG